jgi:type IV pilus assembly protein PilB
MDIDALIQQTGEAPIIKIVNVILCQAISQRASDIHIEPFEKNVRLRYRIDGVLYEDTPPPKHVYPALVSRIKIMSDLDIAERRVPQDGRFKIKVQGKEIDFRVSLLPTAFGEKVVMRVLDKSSVSLNLSSLGFASQSVEKFKECIGKPHGMLLVTGPTGSGKTTTLYSALNLLNNTDVNIVTVEDPIEYQFFGINQVQVATTAGLTFAKGLRSILRQDPDIVMVGEIRDFETVDIAIKAALTGHFVLSTLHTNDAVSTITRIIDMGVEPFLVSSSLVAIVAQRLVRKVCDNCKKRVIIPDNVLKRLDINTDGGTAFYMGKGCDFCKGSGYAGRFSIVEILVITEEIKELINTGKGETAIKRAALANGMMTLREAGIQKVLEGKTSLEEILRVTAAD